MKSELTGKTDAGWLNDRSKYAAYWRELREMDPKDVCRRALAVYRKEQYFSLFFMEEEYLIYPEECRVERQGAPPGESNDPLKLLLLLYLIRSTETLISGKLCSTSALPGGLLFFKGPHSVPDKPIIERFSDNFSGFSEASEKLGGRKSLYGDLSYEFQILPRIPLTVVLWKGDDEFPPRCDFLFDKSVSAQLPLDMILDLLYRVREKLCGDDS